MQQLMGRLLTLSAAAKLPPNGGAHMYKWADGVEFFGRHASVWDALDEAIKAADKLLDHIEGKAKAVQKMDELEFTAVTPKQRET